MPNPTPPRQGAAAEPDFEGATRWAKHWGDMDDDAELCNLARAYLARDAEMKDRKQREVLLRKSLGELTSEVYGDPEAGIPGSREKLAAAQTQAAQVGPLREALRKHCIHIFEHEDARWCALCQFPKWLNSEPESHVPGCLAAQEAQKP